MQKDNEELLLNFLLAIMVICFCLALGYLIHKASIELETTGLKNIILYIWEGSPL